MIAMIFKRPEYFKSFYVTVQLKMENTFQMPPSNLKAMRE